MTSLQWGPTRRTAGRTTPRHPIPRTPAAARRDGENRHAGPVGRESFSRRTEINTRPPDILPILTHAPFRSWNAALEDQRRRAGSCSRGDWTGGWIAPRAEVRVFEPVLAPPRPGITVKVRDVTGSHSLVLRSENQVAAFWTSPANSACDPGMARSSSRPAPGGSHHGSSQVMPRRRPLTRCRGPFRERTENPVHGARSSP